VAYKPERQRRWSKALVRHGADARTAIAAVRRGHSREGRRRLGAILKTGPEADGSCQFVSPAAKCRPDRNSSRCSAFRRQLASRITTEVMARSRPTIPRASSSRPTHMRVAGGQKAILFRKARVLLDREEQLHRLFEAPAEETRDPYLKERLPNRARGAAYRR
jgi:hypothetical protein